MGRMLVATVAGSDTRPAGRRAGTRRPRLDRPRPGRGDGRRGHRRHRHRRPARGLRPGAGGDRLHRARRHGRLRRRSPHRPAPSMSSAPPGSSLRIWRSIKAAARHAVIVRAGNMSLGVNLLVAADAQGRRGARRRLGHRDRRGASPHEGRCALGHRADAGRGGGRRAAASASAMRATPAATASPARGRAAPSAFPPSAAATSSASMT